MFFNSRRWVSLVRGCVGRAVRGRRSRRSGTAWWLERLEHRIVPALITVTSAADNFDLDSQVTLREAIYAANDDVSVDGSTAGSGADTIQFAAGLAGQTITLGGMELLITSALTINGLGASQLTISGSNAIASRIFAVGFGQTTISGLTLTGGRAIAGGEFGGAIRNLGNLTINNCIIAENVSAFGGTSGRGGGVYNSGTLTINNSTIAGNESFVGGGIFNVGTLAIHNTAITNNNGSDDGGGIFNSGTMTINNCMIDVNSSAGDGGGIANNGTATISGGTISGNTANSQSGRGGGISNNAGGLTTNHVTISGNIARISGGGINNSNGAVTINNSLITGNTVEFFGGGIYNYSPAIAINSSTISNNSAGSEGGGLYHFATSLSTGIRNSTISGNTAGGGGGGIHIGFDVDLGSGILNLKSTIVANNDAVGTGDDIQGAILSEFSLIERRPGFSVIETVPGSNRYGLDPLLGPLADNGGPTLTHALLPGSPAINRGSNPVPQSFDARGLGYVRAAGRTDIGAFEVQQKGSYLVPDLINPLNRAVIVVGSPLNDTISVALSGTGATQKYQVTFNGRIQKLPAANVFRIVVRGNDGNDTITLASSVLIGGLLDGGPGEDVLTGSSGNDVLLGGEGDDRLLGLGGRDVLIGGDGHDSLTGGNGDDLLIAGATLYDNSPTALLAIATEWNSPADYATRTKNLREGLNAAPPLNASTIFDGFYDELTADTGATGGLELLFHDILDQLTGVTSPELAVLVP